MPDPLTALLVASVLVALCILVFWPRRGLVDRWRRLRHFSTRVLTEDALKYLFKAELEQQPFTMQGIAGMLQVSLDGAADLLETMEASGLVSWQDDHPRLTKNGRDYAVHVLRAHRLWERHLADRTGFGETDWHALAERYEHVLSPADVRALSADLGYPTHDPHGDPIPTADGAVMPHHGQPLTTVAPNQPVRIVHVEDEPETVYAQLVAEGLQPGMEVWILDKQPERITFWADGDEHVLAPILANNLSVVPLPRAEAAEPYTAEKLSDLEPGQRGRVLRISRACRGAERRRLLDLGLTPGTVVEAELLGPGGESKAYRIRGALMAFRKEQAQRIHITRQEREDIEHGHQTETIDGVSAADLV